MKILGPLFIKNRFSIFERFLAFLTFKFSKGIHCPFLEMNLFSSNMANGASKNLSFHTNFKHENLISVKSASKKF
jgi:hypothetical protein